MGSVNIFLGEASDTEKIYKYKSFKKRNDN